MEISCPHCSSCDTRDFGSRTIKRIGTFYRKSDSRIVQRYKCHHCGRGFSAATRNACYRQNKRHKNEMIRRLLCSGVSQRRIARVLRVHRRTVVRKLLFLATEAEKKLCARNTALPKAQKIQFDDLETFEHTKCKPLSVSLALEEESRRILWFVVSQMPAKGHLAVISRKKYGPRADHRSQAREILFTQLTKLVESRVIIKSDSSPHYPQDIARFFPEATHKTVKGGRGAITGQGELKKQKFDPIFDINHTFAKFRADINRLFRRTWCTTKRPDRLAAHLMVYANYHNENLHLKSR